MKERTQAAGVGDLEWAAAGGPPLTFAERAQYYGGAALDVCATLGLEVSAALRRRVLPELALRELPDTRAVARSVELLATLSPGETAMTHHSHRCWHLAITMARVDSTSLDEEALAVAMLLHDIGLFEAARRLESANEFTVRGARIASRMLRDLGWQSSRVDLVTQAITVNPNARVGRARWGPEAYYGRLAPVCDGLGQTWRIPEGVARAIAARHPFEGLGDAVRRLVAEEAQRQPGGRFSLIQHFFPGMVRLGVKRWARFASPPPT
jgi:hypothetical protein